MHPLVINDDFFSVENNNEFNEFYFFIVNNLWRRYEHKIFDNRLFAGIGCSMLKNWYDWQWHGKIRERRWLNKTIEINLLKFRSNQTACQ